MKHAGWLVAAAWLGCSAEDRVAPEELRGGIYNLRVDTRLDSCDPPRFAGDAGVVAVGVSPEGISGADPFIDTPRTGFGRYLLVAGDGYAGSAVPESDPSEPCGGQSTFAATWALVASTTRGMVVEKTIDWTITAPCTSDVFVPELPTASCRAEQDHVYQLVTACEPPCKLAQPAPGQLTCSCDP